MLKEGFLCVAKNKEQYGIFNFLNYKEERKLWLRGD